MWTDLAGWNGGFWTLRRGQPAWSWAEVALVGGYRSDRLAFAFASGHQTALRRLLVDDLGLELEQRVGALCITEAKGAHPRTIETTATRAEGGWRISGTKTYTTLLPLASTLFVACRLEAPGVSGRPQIRVARIDPHAPGVSKTPMPPTPFCPELPHGITAMVGVDLTSNSMVEADGYADVIRPFRTVEDIHVTLALVGYLLGVAQRHRWPDGARQELVGIAIALGALDGGSPSDPAVHIALEGVLTQLARWRSEHSPLWDEASEPERLRWRRDQPVLKIAHKARQARKDRAWAKLRSGSTPSADAVVRSKPTA